MSTARELGWSRLTNGALLDAAEGMVTRRWCASCWALAESSSEEAVQLLLDAGTDPAARDTAGCGALGHVYSGPESEGARNLLLSAGAVACPR